MKSWTSMCACNHIMRQHRAIWVCGSYAVHLKHKSKNLYHYQSKVFVYIISSCCALAVDLFFNSEIPLNLCILSAKVEIYHASDSS